MERLRSRIWFQESETVVQETLTNLGDDCNGYLADLANRPDVIGGVRLMAIHRVQTGDVRIIFGILTVFLVQNVKSGQSYHYQYFSWKQGPFSGTKGVLLVRSGNHTTHLVLVKGESFAVAGPIYDCPGGFMEVGDQKTLDLATGFVNRMCREVEEVIGLQLSTKDMRIHNLGRVYADPGMTNNTPALFAIEIDGNTAATIEEGKVNNIDKFELASGPVIVPVAQLWGAGGLIETNNHSMFHVIVTRLQSRGLIQGPA